MGAAKIGSLEGPDRVSIGEIKAARPAFRPCRRWGVAVNNPAGAAPTCCGQGTTAHDDDPTRNARQPYHPCETYIGDRRHGNVSGNRGWSKENSARQGREEKAKSSRRAARAPAVLDAGLTPGIATAVTATAGTLVTDAPLVSFTDGASPLPANDYAATIDWGDGTPTSGGTISVSGTTFTVAGSHNFAQPSTAQPGGVYTVSVVIVGDGQQVSTTTSATVGGLHYGFVSSPILPIELAPLEAVAGTPTPGLGLGPFWASPAPDPTAYSAVIDWGDGSTTSTATITGAASGTLDASTSGHTYAAAGPYTITTTVRDSQGFVVGTGTDPIYVSDPVATPASSLTATAGIPTGPLSVATITAESYAVPLTSPSGALPTVSATLTGQPDFNLDSSYYTAVVDWGDGSPPVDANFTFLDAYDLDVTTSGHTYSQSGTYTLTLTVRDAQGVVVDMVNPTIAVSAPLSGGLGSQSDTVGPVVTGMTFKRSTATAVITYQDNQSGLDLASISNPAFYHLSARTLSNRVREPRLIIAKTVSVTQGASPTSPDVVTVVFPHKGKALRRVATCW